MIGSTCFFLIPIPLFVAIRICVSRHIFQEFLLCINHLFCFLLPLWNDTNKCSKNKNYWMKVLCQKNRGLTHWSSSITCTSPLVPGGNTHLIFLIVFFGIVLSHLLLFLGHTLASDVQSAPKSSRITALGLTCNLQ